MAFCANCGNKVGEGLKFCPSCGTAVAGGSSGASVPAKQSGGGAPDKATPEGTAAAKLSASKILGATKSFVVVRALVCIGIMVAMLVVGAIGLLICVPLALKGLTVPAFIIGIIFFGGIFGLLRFVKRYFLYMIKAAHIAAMTEYIKTGTAPTTVNGYKGVLAYGTEKIKKNFVTANVAFVADALIAGATRQIMRWVNKVQNLFSFIPGAKTVMGFVNLVLSTALNYIDEAILSYVFYHEKEKNGFKKACDGLVLYGQSWKGMLKGALKVAVFVWLLRIGLFIIFYLICAALASGAGSVATLIGIVVALILIYGIQSVIIDPFATCVMVNDYHKAIAGQTVKADLHETLCKVSRKFKSLFDKSKEPIPAEPAVA